MDRKPVKAKSYANIAIIKYWGKEDAKQMVPSTSSISLTLENMYTETSLSPLPADATAHEFYIDGEFQNPAEQAKIGAVIDGLKPANEAGFVQWIPATTCQQQQVCPLARVGSLLSSRLAIGIMIWA